MAISLQKGGHVNLSNEAPGLRRLLLNLVWRGKQPCMPQISAYLLDIEGKLRSAQDIISHHKPVSHCHSVHFAARQGLLANEQTSTQTSEATQLQRIVIDLALIPDDVEKICFTLSLAPPLQLKQALLTAHLSCCDARDGKQIASYDFVDDCQNSPSMLCGEIFRNGIDWKLKALGKACHCESSMLPMHFGYQELN
jgi:tellurium resistance protein TerD